MLPRDHPYRTDDRWPAPEPLGPPQMRTDKQTRKYTRMAVRLVRLVRRGVRGAKAALCRLGQKAGIIGDSATSPISHHDEVKCNPVDGMHTIAVAADRMLCSFTGAGDRVDPLLKNLANAASVAAAAATAAAADNAPKSRAATGLASAAPRGKRSARGGKRSARGGARGTKASTWTYTKVENHRDDDHGERTEYSVAWPNGERTWEPARTFTTDAERSEGPVNAVLMYELSLVPDVPAFVELHARLTRNRPLRHEHDAVAESVDHLRALRRSDAELSEMDASLNRLPYNSETLPWRGRNPMTHPSRLKMHDIHSWLTTGMAEFQLRGRLSGDTGRIAVRWLRAMAALYTPVVTLQTISAIETELWEASSELEIVWPQSDLSILMLHAPSHLPEQMRWLGPLSVHDMWGFEGCVFSL